MSIVYTATTGTTSPDLKTGIEYAIGILEGDMKQEYTPNSSSVSALCTCSYEDSDLFLAEMLGYSKKVGTELQRVLPEKSGWDNPALTDEIHYALDARLVKSLKWIENDTFTGWPVYAEMVYLVTFGAPLYEVLEDDEAALLGGEQNRFVVWTKRGAAQNEKIPGGAYWIPAAGAIGAKKLNEVGVRTGRTLSLTAKWLDVPYVNYTTLSGLANKVNASAITFDDTEYAAETVLFENWSEDKRVNAFGGRVVDLTFNFTVRIDGRTWNKVWTGYDSPYEYLAPTNKADGTGTKLFATADLTDCFSFS